MNSQLTIFDKKEPIETVVIIPTKEMPLEVFLRLHRLAYFMELMERTSDGKVIWDETVTDIYSEDLAQVEYVALQEDMFSVNMELPKVIVEKMSNEKENRL